MRVSLQQSLKQLRLSGLAQSLDVRLAEASGNHLDHAEFLELILQDELNVRTSRQVDRRVRAAQFRDVKNLDEFDFTFNSSIKRKQIHDLATCAFLRNKADVLLLGPPGVGKTFLVQAIGHQAIKAGFLVLYRSIFDLARDFLGDEDLGHQDKTLNRYLKPDLLIIDDMGMRQLPRRSGECLLEIIMRRHENRSGGHRDPRPLSPARHDHQYHRKELPVAWRRQCPGRGSQARNRRTISSGDRSRRDKNNTRTAEYRRLDEGLPPGRQRQQATIFLTSASSVEPCGGIRRSDGSIKQRLITQTKLAWNGTDEVYEASQYWPVLSAPRWLVLARPVTPQSNWIVASSAPPVSF
jgi:DNA replication protein DnaC